MADFCFGCTERAARTSAVSVSKATHNFCVASVSSVRKRQQLASDTAVSTTGGIVTLRTQNASEARTAVIYATSALKSLTRNDTSDAPCQPHVTATSSVSHCQPFLS